VRVPNAIGVVRVEGLHIVVEPKIPLPHVIHLFERSGAFPRLDANMADLASAESLWPLVAAWYLTALERLLSSGLASGYQHAREEMAVARGRLVTGATARAFLKGRVLLDCEYEEFDVDTPLNRVLKAAANAVGASAALSWDVRRRATRAVNHMEGIGPLKHADPIVARVERHTVRYVLPFQLARHVLAATGRGIDVGEEHGHAFLIRTPDMVEEGIRRIVVDALEDRIDVTKRTWFLSGSHHSLTPDLVFGECAVGDVKYKVWAGDWDRSDLYQLVAFATAFGAHDALRVGFASADHGFSVNRVGRVGLAACDWMCDATTTPANAERALSHQLWAWWEGVERRVGVLADDRAGSDFATS
jgi:5-methylcytosine-specific restriction endonuclease McrBC regulatory subunit McrC